jgi:Ca-activated chloride channel family protein
MDAMKQVPDAKPLLFVLTDGETNRGLTFDRVSNVIAGTGIPVYTISYGEDIAELSRLSALNEAASLKADPLDIAYQIGALLNAEM